MANDKVSVDKKVLVDAEKVLDFYINNGQGPGDVTLPLTTITASEVLKAIRKALGK